MSCHFFIVNSNKTYLTFTQKLMQNYRKTMLNYCTSCIEGSKIFNINVLLLRITYRLQKNGTFGKFGCAIYILNRPWMSGRLQFLPLQLLQKRTQPKCSSLYILFLFIIISFPYLNISTVYPPFQSIKDNNICQNTMIICVKEDQSIAQT